MAFTDKKKKAPEDNAARDEFIRRFKTKPALFVGTILVLVIVIVAFVFVPAIVPSAARSVDLTFGSYNKIPITYAPGNYLAQVQEELARRYQQYMQFMQAQIWREAFNETVIHTGILDEMKRAGYTAPADMVDRRIAEQPDLLALYRRYDNNSKMSLWKQIQEGISEEYYRLDMTGFKVPAAEAAFIGAMASRERSFSLAALPVSSYPAAEVAAYAEANPDLFRLTRLSRITVKSSAKEAEQILATIRGEVTAFEEAAGTHSQDAYADRGGEMGQKLAWELEVEIPGREDREKVLALGKGELSQVIKVPEGWAFFRAEEAAAPADTADPTVMERVRSYIMEFVRSRAEDWVIGDAGDLAALIREDGLEEALYRRGIEKRSFGPLALNYGDTDLFPRLASFNVAELYRAEESENFWRAAFSTPLKTPSTPLVLGDYVVILYPEEETEEAGPESSAARLETAYASYMLANIINQNIRTWFITSDKLEDRFAETYTRYFQSSY